MLSNYWKTLLVLLGTVLLSIQIPQNVSAQDILTPTPVPTPIVPALPPGDTVILVIGAVILVLIVFGAVVWASKRPAK